MRRACYFPTCVVAWGNAVLGEIWDRSVGLASDDREAGASRRRFAREKKTLSLEVMPRTVDGGAAGCVFFIRWWVDHSLVGKRYGGGSHPLFLGLSIRISHPLFRGLNCGVRHPLFRGLVN